MTSKRLFTATAVAAVAYAPIGLAQDQDDLVGEDIIVEGELQSRTLQETQTSVTVVTGEDLESRSDFNLRSVAERTAGVSTSARGIGFVIRGFDERGIDQNGSSAPAISTTVDGARITDFGRINTTFLSTWDLEQVEFLRGPQSTQSGRNALAGAVVVRSKDPTYDQEFKARASLGNFGTVSAAAAFNQPIIEDVLAFRFSGEFNLTDGFIDNITTGADDDGGVENINVRAGLRFDPSDDLWAVLKLSHFQNVEGFASSTTQAYPRRTIPTDAITDDRSDYRTANLRIGYDVSDSFELESETTFVDRRFLFQGDFDGTGQPLATAFDDQTDQSFSQELKLFYETDRIKGVVGGFFTRIEGTSDAAGTLPAALLGIPPAALAMVGLTPLDVLTISVTGANVIKSETQNFAVFGEVDAEIFDGVRLIAGARYDRETQERARTPVTTASNPALAPLLPADTPTATSTTFDAFLPKAGIVYEFTDDVSLGFTFQRGYRPGGAGVNLARNTEFEFDAEFSNNYELAFRSQWFDNALTVNANAYYVKYSDQQVVVPEFINGVNLGTQDRKTVNAGSSKSFGGELEAQATPIDGLDLFAAVGYNETEFTDFLSFDQTGAQIQLAGREFRNAPRWTGSAGGTYYFGEGSFLDGFFVGGEASFTSGSFNDALNAGVTRSDARWLLNLRAGYQIENFTITAFVDNVTDNIYTEEVTPTLTTIGDPRTYGLIGQIDF